MTLFVLERLASDEYGLYEVVGVFTSEALATVYGDRLRPLQYPYDLARNWIVSEYQVDPDVDDAIAALPVKLAVEGPVYIVDSALTDVSSAFMRLNRRG